MAVGRDRGEIQVGAGREMERRIVRILSRQRPAEAGRTAGRLAGMLPGTGIAQRIAVESLQRVVVAVLPEPAGERPAAADVPGHLGECRIVPVHALLIGEPDRVVVETRYGEVRAEPLRIVGVRIAAEAGHDVVLPDLMHLALGEQAHRGLDEIVLRTARPQLVAPLGVVAVLDHELLRHDRRAAHCWSRTVRIRSTCRTSKNSPE